jgi:hypothetical protein
MSKEPKAVKESLYTTRFVLQIDILEIFSLDSELILQYIPPASAF